MTDMKDWRSIRKEEMMKLRGIEMEDHETIVGEMG